MNFKGIRDWFEEHKINRHITIELKSTGIILLLENPNKERKALLQICSTEKNPRIGIWGGGIEKNETPKATAVRELKEELGIEVSKNDLNFFENNEHDLEYKNGDKAHYWATVYTLNLNEIPSIKLDEESNGIITISKNNYENFINVDNPKFLQIEKYWVNTIKKVLYE